jgi:hypothetical protein
MFAAAEAGFLVRVHPEPCLILSRAQIRALLFSSKSKFIPAQTLTLLVLDKKKRPLQLNEEQQTARHAGWLDGRIQTLTLDMSHVTSVTHV